MNDYNDLMNEYQDVKNKISQESFNVMNTVFIIKAFENGIESFKNNILKSPKDKPKAYENIEKDIILFSNKLIKIKYSLENEIIIPLNNLVESVNTICSQNIDAFNEIKIALIQERQKLNKTKDDYFNFVLLNSIKDYKNEDEKVLYNAKKENYYQLYKYEVDQMNTIIEKNNTKYENLYNDIWSSREILKLKIKDFFMRFSKNMENFGNELIEFSKNISNDINQEKEFDKISLDKERAKVKNPRFDKVELEEPIENKINNNNIIQNNPKKENDLCKTPLGPKSVNLKSDFDVVEEDEKCLKEMKTFRENQKGNKSTKNIFNLKKKTKTKNLLGKEKNKNQNSINSTSSVHKGFDDFEIVDNSFSQKDNQEKNDKLIKDIINKIMSEEELLSQEISDLMNLMKEDDPSTKKLYSYTFLTKLSQLNDKYIVILKNEKNFIHLSNILNDISINQNKIDILKLIIDISQVITYKEWHLFNLLQKKNKYLSTKTFWSKIVLDSFINDLNKKVKELLKAQLTKSENIKTKEKENSVYLIEFMQFSKQIINYKKLNPEQKRKLDNYGMSNISNILIKAIEGMCSFLVQKNVTMEVIDDFGKNFGFDKKTKNYYELLIDVYLNRNYLYNLKKLSLHDNKDKNLSNICLISSAANFLPKDNLLNLLILGKAMTKDIKNNIFRNYLNQKISIDERLRIWGIILKIDDLKKEYNYKEKKEELLKLIENNELPKDSRTFQNIGIITLDVNRTFFKNKDEIKERQKSIQNILNTLIYTYKEISYFQGMNYIAAFFFQVFDFDEEQTFYYMLGIEKNTKFKELFEKDLYLLTLFFTVFEKILKINIPEIYRHQMNNQIDPNYYLPPWFLTLFTFISTKFEKDKVPKFILLVIETFLLNGWSAIFNAGYTIIKHLRNKIINIKGDSLMHYMVNNFGQDEILREENFPIVRSKYLKNSYQINEELISKLIKITEYERNKK